MMKTFGKLLYSAGNGTKNVILEPVIFSISLNKKASKNISKKK